MAERNLRPRNGRKKWIKPAAVVGIAAVVIAAAAIAFTTAYNSDDSKENGNAVVSDSGKDSFDNGKIYQNISINNIDVGNMSKEEAIQKIEREVKIPFEKSEIVFNANGEKVPFNYSQFGITMNVESAVNDAYNYAREGTKDERKSLYNKLKDGEKKSFSINIFNETGSLSDEIKQNIKNEIEKGLKDKVYVAPKDATIKKGTAGFEITHEENGRELDSEKAVNMVVEYIISSQNVETSDNNSVKEFETPIKDVPAKITYEQLLQVKDTIGVYSTKYSGSQSSGRVINMKVAASHMNGTVVAPGDVFSTNKCFGESTPENGYKLAGAYINGKLDQDYGGGVCQVSTTLYNAVLRAELEVVERANHSLTVGYVPRGFDATLAGDYIDFKFKNNSSCPVYIESYVTNNQVVVNIYGKEEHPAGRTLEFRNEFSKGVYKTYKKVYQNGKFVEEVYLSRSVYKNIDVDGRVIVSETTTERTTAETTTEATTAAPVSNKENKTAQNDNTSTDTPSTGNVMPPATEPTENNLKNNNSNSTNNSDENQEPVQQDSVNDVIIVPPDDDSGGGVEIDEEPM